MRCNAFWVVERGFQRAVVSEERGARRLCSPQLTWCLEWWSAGRVWARNWTYEISKNVKNRLVCAITEIHAHSCLCAFEYRDELCYQPRL